MISRTYCISASAGEKYRNCQFPDKCSSGGLLSGKIFYTGHICAGLDFVDAGYAGVFWTDFVIDRNYGNLFNEHS